MSSSVWELAIYSFVVVVLVFPLWRIFKRAGKHPAFSLLVFMPFGLLIVTLILSFSRWPAIEKPSHDGNAVGG